MLKRFVMPVMLGLALLFTQGGVLVVAALCPHPQVNVPVCDASMNHGQQMHHDVSSPAPAPDDTKENLAVGEQVPSCSHCVVHSSPSNLVLLRTADTSKRSIDSSIARVILTAPAAASASGVALLTSRAHAPPGGSIRSRHILISTFRI